MRYRGEILRNRRNETGLLYRKIAQRVDVKTAMSPLFRYMRWYASRTPDEIYFLSVDPTAIDRMKLFPPSGVPVTGPDALCGAVGGPWDRLTLSVENHYLYRSIRAHLESGAPWSETPLYRHPKYHDEPDRARRRSEKIERLIESIEDNDYRRQFDPDADASRRDESIPSNERIGDVHVGDEMIVGVDRNGDLIHLKNGRHRLAVAQLLELDRIPVILSLYHPRARSEISEDAELIYPA